MAWPMCLVKPWNSHSSKTRHNREGESRQRVGPKKLLRHKSSDPHRRGLPVVLPPKPQGCLQKQGICVLAE